jgi:hypothetical protein
MFNNKTKYELPNTQARSRNNCYRGKALSITYNERVFIPLIIQHAMRMRHIIICVLSGSIVFVHIIS